MESFIAQITMFAGNFAPRSWAFCDGQLLPISQNSALFSLIGTIYGGDGRTTFALPDLRGRVPMHPGDGAGLSSRRIGEKSGLERTTLTEANIPSHSHTILIVEEATEEVGSGNYLANGQHYGSGTPSSMMGRGSISNTGGNQSFNNMQPFLCVNFIISLQGMFPTRS
jgi:microcystin-dependent protein